MTDALRLLKTVMVVVNALPFILFSIDLGLTFHALTFLGCVETNPVVVACGFPLSIGLNFIAFGSLTFLHGVGRFFIGEPYQVVRWLGVFLLACCAVSCVYVALGSVGAILHNLQVSWEVIHA